MVTLLPVTMVYREKPIIFSCGCRESSVGVTHTVKYLVVMPCPQHQKIIDPELAIALSQ